MDEGRLVVSQSGKKVKQAMYNPGQALRIPGGGSSQISRHSTHEDGKFVSPTRRPTLSPRKYSSYFLLRLIRPQGHNAAGRIVSMINSSDNIGNQNRDLPGCRAVPQPTAIPRVPARSGSSVCYSKLYTYQYSTLRNSKMSNKQK